jgi:hypothetical protein
MAGGRELFFMWRNLKTRDQQSIGNLVGNLEISSLTEDLEEGAEFVFGFGGGVDGFGDFGADEFGETATEARHGHADGGFGLLEGGGCVGIARGISGVVQEWFYDAEEMVLAREGAFFLETGHGASEQGQSPAAVEDAVGSEGIDWFPGVALFGLERVDGKDDAVAAPFLGEIAVVGVGEKMFECAEEVPAETAARWGSGGKEAAGEKRGEKILGEIAGIFRRMTGASDRGVGGRPVNAAECFESTGAGAARRGVGIGDETPVGSGENGRWGEGRRHGGRIGRSLFEPQRHGGTEKFE